MMKKYNQGAKAEFYSSTEAKSRNNPPSGRLSDPKG